MIWLRYWKPIAGITVLILGMAFAWNQGGKSARLACAEAQAKALAQAQHEADKANEALREQLRKPPAAAGIREIVRANPSDCRVPEPVVRGLREAVDRANESAR